MHTPENITTLKQNEVFVYGSNQYGQHNGGAAKKAIDFGAIYGDCQAGLCGNTYGIITTSFNEEPINIAFLRTQIDMLYKFASVRPDLIFYVTKIGTGIAGWGLELIAGLFKDREYFRPSNIILPIEFSTVK